MDRTLMSAQAMLAGLYHPPRGDQLWKPDLPWMPIPVHTEPRSQDFVSTWGPFTVSVSDCNITNK